MLLCVVLGSSLKMTHLTFFYFYSRAVFPELIVAANRWSPLTDPKPVHEWLTPYFKLFEITNFTDSQKEFSKVSQIVQTKLGDCLDQAGWTVTDLSAVKMLTPLHSMWTLDAWRVFTNRFIIPKLKKHLFTIPHKHLNKAIQEFKFFSAWFVLLEIQVVDNLLNDVFFPEFFSQLNRELRKDCDEIAEWYWAWREVLSPLFMNSKSVIEKLSYVLQTISNTLRLQKTSVQDKEKYVHNHRQTFKELLQKRCEKANIEFFPGRKQNGRQLYKVGVQWCYIDQNVLFKNADNSMVSLNDIHKLLVA